ncbi:STT3 domain-containing protein [Methanobacterium aggregans]|uniref:STT3 domain-containing protein n=1 Tax=Methanobacterium aggregans TaxID=1615586 RepID=UPI001AE7B8FD|nr:STT3 domain-containing protein [Methanobacterium aggregans]MBP2046491.1 dolichyl-diphosphooligosaccharide--protein glycosyltransferase [Methanobacterium aggregans]
MNARKVFSKYKPLIIIILLFLLVFSLRAEAANIPGVPSSMKAYYEDANGLPYFSEMDSYYNYRMTQDFLTNGHLGDTKVNGTNWDLHSYYPSGRSADYPPLIVYVTAFTYKIANAFADVPLAEVCFWMGAFIASLCVIPSYLLVRRITNDYGGIVAAVLAGLAPSYFAHTFAGFFDTDMFNILLPLLVVWFFIESLRANTMKNRTIFAVLSAASMLVFSMAWEGWWYIFYIIIGAVVVYLLVSQYLLNMKTIKPVSEYPSKIEWFKDQHEIFSLVVFLVVGLAVMLMALGSSGLTSALLEPLGASQLQSAVQNTAYPNVFVSVSELQVPGISSVVAGVGGVLPFVFGILGVLLMFWQLKPKTKKEEPKKRDKNSRRKKNKSKRRKEEKPVEAEDKNKIKAAMEKERRNYLFYGILFSIWLLILAYAMTKGVRFIEPFTLPIALSAGIFVGLLFGYLKDHIKTSGYQYVAIAILMVLAIYSPIASAYAVSTSVVPGTDDSMVSSLAWINQNTANNTIVTSWWDYGHLFTAVADRPVTFDGGSQNSLRAYWVGKAMLTSNETLSAGILKMLATSGDQGPLTLENYTKDTGKSVEILNNILGVDKTQAQTILTTKYGLTAQQAQNVLKYTHPDKAVPQVFITSSDMVGKALWWSYFGSWNFTSQNGTSSGYSVAQANATKVGNNTLILGSNAVVGLVSGSNMSVGLLNVNEVQNEVNQTGSSQVLSSIATELQTGNGSLVEKPHKLLVINNGNVTQNQTVSNDSNFSVYVFAQNNTYVTVAMNRELEDSMFTRMFFLNGYGLTHFTQKYAQAGVIVWSVT